MLLDKIPEGDARTSYAHDDYLFHILVDKGITYVCLADEKDKSRVPFMFLEAIRDAFQTNYGERAYTAIAFAMNADFQREMEGTMRQFNMNPPNDAFTKVQGQINEVKSTLTENINKVLARGEKIELLVDKTEQLNMSANKFQKSARTLKRAMWWKNVKMWIVIVVILIVIIWLISSFACGFDYSKCSGSGGEE